MTLIGPDKPYFDAVDNVVYQWEFFSDSKNPVAQAHYLIELSNAVSDLKSYLESYDWVTGTVNWEREDE